MEEKEDKQPEDLSFQQELWNTFVERWKALMEWMKPEKQHSILVNLLKYIYKIPVLLFVLCISPFVLLFLFIIFVALL